MIDYFGFLNYYHSIIFEDVRIVPAITFKKNQNWINEYLNKDGFIYAPLINEVEINLSGEKKRVIPNTEKPALLHKIPFSHSINVNKPIYKHNLRKWDYGFLINVLAFVLGTRVQFYNWWFDGRIQIENKEGISISPSSLPEFLSTVYETWKSWEEINKERIMNLLVMHNRIPQYEWDFERFLFNYIVFDGAFGIAEKVYKCKATNHKKRFYSIIEKFDMYPNQEYINDIYNLRNDLFHDAIWDGGLPNTVTDKYKGWQKEIALRKLNIRIIIALLNYKTKFISTPWWNFGTYVIDSKFYK